MAEADAESALTWVALQSVLAALEAIPAESPEGARLLVIRGCANEQIRWRVREPAEPPPNFWRGHPSNFDFSYSNVTNRATMAIMSDGIPDLVAVTLRSVSLAWEDVAALRPEIDPRPSSSTRSEIGSPSSSAGPQVEHARELMTAVFPSGDWTSMGPVAVRHACEAEARNGNRPLPSTDSFARAMGRRARKPRK
jgi:hypothetical protein